jgi:hypothetical protein
MPLTQTPVTLRVEETGGKAQRLVHNWKTGHKIHQACQTWAIVT